jgi:hypothetical protein
MASKRKLTSVRRQYLSWRVSEARRELKLKAIIYKGGKCQAPECGYNRCPAALQFHHLDPTRKDFQISGGKTRSWERIKKELDKTIMLCANCHLEAHHQIAESKRVGQEAKIRALTPARQPAPHGSPGILLGVGATPVGSLTTNAFGTTKRMREQLQLHSLVPGPVAGEGRDHPSGCMCG